MQAGNAGDGLTSFKGVIVDAGALRVAVTPAEAGGVQLHVSDAQGWLLGVHAFPEHTSYVRRPGYAVTDLDEEDEEDEARRTPTEPIEWGDWPAWPVDVTNKRKRKGKQAEAEEAEQPRPVQMFSEAIACYVHWHKTGRMSLEDAKRNIATIMLDFQAYCDSEAGDILANTDEAGTDEEAA